MACYWHHVTSIEWKKKQYKTKDHSNAHGWLCIACMHNGRFCKMKEKKTDGKKNYVKKKKNKDTQKKLSFVYSPMKVIWINKNEIPTYSKIWFSKPANSIQRPAHGNQKEEKIKQAVHFVSTCIALLSFCVFHFISRKCILNRKNKIATTSANQIECKVNVNQRCNKKNTDRTSNQALASARYSILQQINGVKCIMRLTAAKTKPRSSPLEMKYTCLWNFVCMQYALLRVRHIQNVRILCTLAS